MIVMYHNIGDDSGFNTVSRDSFIEHLIFLRSRKNIVSLDEYVRILSSGKDTSGYAVISFDDGYISFKTHVIPVLEKYAVEAALFMPVNYAGKTNSWEKPGSPIYDIMSWDDLAVISGHELVTIGSHGLSHMPIGNLPADMQDKEITLSKDILEKKIEKKIEHFSFPYGQSRDINLSKSDVLRGSGYKSACSTLYGRFNGIKDIYRLKRIEIRPYDKLKDFKKHIETNMNMVYIKQKIKEIISKIY